MTEAKEASAIWRRGEQIRNLSESLNSRAWHNDAVSQRQLPIFGRGLFLSSSFSHFTKRKGGKVRFDAISDTSGPSVHFEVTDRHGGYSTFRPAAEFVRAVKRKWARNKAPVPLAVADALNNLAALMVFERISKEMSRKDRSLRRG